MHVGTTPSRFGGFLSAFRPIIFARLPILYYFLMVKFFFFNRSFILSHPRASTIETILNTPVQVIYTVFFGHSDSFIHVFTPSLTPSLPLNLSLPFRTKNHAILLRSVFGSSFSSRISP